MKNKLMLLATALLFSSLAHAELRGVAVDVSGNGYSIPKPVHMNMKVLSSSISDEGLLITVKGARESAEKWFIPDAQLSLHGTTALALTAKLKESETVDPKTDNKVVTIGATYKEIKQFPNGQRAYLINAYSVSSYEK